MNTDVVLVNPPILDRRSIEIPTRAHNPFEHIGLGYIASYLRKYGYEVKIIDSYIVNRTIAETVSLIEKESPRLVGMSATHEFLTAAVDIAGCLREDGYDGHITLGGYLSTFLHDKIIAEYPCFDSIVRGEGEITIVELMKNLSAPSEWNSIAGLTYRDNGEIRVNPPRDLIPDLDVLPHPARDTLPDLARMYDYSAISSSRGCPMNCSFCSIHKFYRQSKGACWRARSPQNIADEIEILTKKHNVQQVAFTDDNFFGIPGAGKNRALKIARAILSRGVKVEFSVLCRVNDLEEGLLRLLKISGLRSLFVGFESGCNRALKTFNKKITVEQNRKAVDLIKKVGIKCFPGFIMFDPYTTLEEIKKNIEFVDYVEKDSDLIKIDDLLGSLQPFTGTSIREKLEREGRIIYPDSPLLRMDVIPTYEIEDPRVETLKRAMKNNRNSLSRPLFDDFNRLKRNTPDDKRSEFKLVADKFNNLVQRMRDFEKAFFRECIAFIEKNPRIQPEESYRLEEMAVPEVKSLNREIEEINREIEFERQE
ncbi:MAG: B12-binding domain-containing radical SAM protein [Candidatus Eremiobacteraeota bacterium]|nr:B12-binding domain-containing radical SAM protein [Candidatus Eremiobacteraeota bacterium]